MITKDTIFRGHFTGTENDLIRPFVLRGSGQTDRARRLAPIYMKYDRKFNIRADLAFAQMCHETGMLEFTGISKPEWNNFAGLGITGPGAKQTFATEDLGVLAHMIHLAWYFFPEHINSLCSRTYDPRHFESAGKHHPRYTGDLRISFLAGQWAYPGTVYAQKIAFYANIINDNLDNNIPDVEEPPVVIPPSLDYDVIIQMGHVPRTSGATGTAGEQAINKSIGMVMETLLKQTHIKYRIMGADNWEKPEPNKSTIFLALHCDGSTSPDARGFSMGYKPGSNQDFKEWLATAYGKLSGFTRRKDNYTTGMSKYYGWKHIDATYPVLIEHGFLTNQVERDWIKSHIAEIAKSHVDVIVKTIQGVKNVKG